MRYVYKLDFYIVRNLITRINIYGFYLIFKIDPLLFQDALYDFCCVRPAYYWSVKFIGNVRHSPYMVKMRVAYHNGLNIIPYLIQDGNIWNSSDIHQLLCIYFYQILVFSKLDVVFKMNPQINNYDFSINIDSGAIFPDFIIAANCINLNHCSIKKGCV